MIDGHGKALYPGGLKDYLVWHERRPGIGMLSGWRGFDEDKQGMGEPNRRQLERYIENGCFWRGEIPEKGRFYRFANRDFFDWAIPRGFLDKAQQIVLQLYSEPLRKFQLAAEGHGTRQPPDHLRARVMQGFDPLPSWYPPFGAKADSEGYVLHAITQRPMHMYHSWGSQNAWLRQIQARNPLFIARKLGERLGLIDGDWVWIESPHGQVKAEIKLMEGVNQDTVWTWNAIGKRKGAWNLSPTAPESAKGFLLNHVISELLPPQPDGHRYANIDPVTGQAAWYDLKVRLRKCAPEEAGETAPSFEPLNTKLPKPGGDLAYGAEFRAHRAETSRGRA
jgi:anaerobic selenocysteine-containing dehydrogenase